MNMATEKDFWTFAHSLQQQGVLCDMQLCVVNPPVSFPVHRLVLLASSAYYQNSMLQGDLQDTYYFDGIKEENLQLLVSYCYRQISWSELTKSAEAAIAAQTLQLVQHSEVHDRSPVEEITMQKSDNPEMVVVRVGPTGEEMESTDTAESNQAGGNKDKERQKARDEGDGELAVQENCTQSNDISKEASKICPLGSGSSNKKRRTIVSPKRNRSKALVEPRSEENVNESITKDSRHVSGRTSKRKRKVSSKYADFEDVPQFHVPRSLSKAKELKNEANVTHGKMSKSAEVANTQSQEQFSVESNRDRNPGVQGAADDGESLVDEIVSGEVQGEEISIIITVDEETSSLEEEKQDRSVSVKVINGDGKNLQDGEGSGESEKKPRSTEDSEEFKDTTEAICEVCGGSFTKLALCISHEVRIHKYQRKLVCTSCSKTFHETRQLLRHINDVHGSKGYDCDSCKAHFKSREGLALHRRKKHSTDGGNIHCDQCGKTFLQSSQLKSHIIFKHSSERTEACENCHRTFKTKALLKRHTATYHSSERKHMCDLCGSMFKTVNDMRMHRKKHYKKDGTFVGEVVPRNKLLYPPGDYPCRFCNKAFRKYHVRTTHEKNIHIEKLQGNLFICTICNKSFPIKPSLLGHIKTRHLPRKYECQDCHQKFVTERDLMRHVQTPHRCREGIRALRKPYWCTDCQIGFSLKGNLTKHIQKGLCLRNKKVTTNYVVVLQKLPDTGEGNTSPRKRLEKIIALEEGWEKAQEIMEGYKGDDMMEAELLSEQTVDTLEEHLVEEVVGQQAIGVGEEIILHQREDGTMVIPYSTEATGQTFECLNLTELQQAALAAGGNVEIEIPEGKNIGDIASVLGGNIQIRVEDSVGNTSVVSPVGETVLEIPVAEDEIRDTLPVQNDPETASDSQ